MNVKANAKLTLAAMLISGASLHAQTPPKDVAFQYFVTEDKVVGPMTIRVDGIGRPVTGKPFSGTEVRHTLQVLGDGTRIDKEETNRYFRDNEGRSRVERDNGATVTISDPVAGFSAEMSATTKTVRKNMIVRGGSISPVATTTASAGADNSRMKEKLDKVTAELGEKMSAARITQDATLAEASSTTSFARTETFTVRKDSTDPKAAVEDLGIQLINGVRAQGTRSTITIPVGQIGNDREIKVVSERWFSADLGMLIRSSNNDPRFGETTYEMSNILQGAQDPTLFQIPSDFSTKGAR